MPNINNIIKIIRKEYLNGGMHKEMIYAITIVPKKSKIAILNNL
jgi:hypothetical protein